MGAMTFFNFLYSHPTDATYMYTYQISSWYENFDERQPIAKGHLSDSGDLKKARVGVGRGTEIVKKKKKGIPVRQKKACLKGKHFILTVLNMPSSLFLILQNHESRNIWNFLPKQIIIQ